jgi:hypothetical protein
VTNKPTEQGTVSATTLLAEIRGVLSGFGTFANAVGNQTDLLPESGSQASREWEASEEADIAEVHTAYSTAAILLAAAQNHLEATSRLLVEPLPEFGIFATCRSAMENAGRAWWLLDPELSPQLRAGRGLAARISSLSEARDVEAILKPEVPLLELSYNKPLKRVLERARKQGFEVQLIDRKRDRYRLAQEKLRTPSSTELLRLMHEDLGAFMYKFLSAAVHGTSYALLQSFEYEADTRGGMGYIARPDNKLDMLAFAIGTTALAYVDGYGRWIDLYGHYVEEWHSWRIHALKTIRKSIPPEALEDGS